MKLRKATIKDLPVILEIMNYEILNTTAIYEYDVRLLEDLKEWFKNKSAKEMPVIVAVSNEEVIGFGTYDSFRPRIGYKNTIEHSVYIAKEHQGKGAGKLLLKSLLTIAKEKGYHTMIGRIDAENKGSIIFHEKLGFKEVGRLKEVGYKFDKWLDVVYMQRII